MALLDTETIERLSSLSPKDAIREVKSAMYRGGATTSDDFHEVFEQLVDAGVLTWDEIDRLDE